MEWLELDDEIYWVNGKPRSGKSTKWNPSGVSDLIDEIVYKANGVFLWAYLAMQDLVSGIWSKDSLSTLERRLDHLDNTLEGLFEQLLRRIHLVHRSSAANYIKFELIWNSPELGFDDELTIMDVTFACDVELGSDLQELAVMDQNQVIVLRQAADRCAQKLHAFAVALCTQCAGLLDVNLSRRSLTRKARFMIDTPEKYRNSATDWNLSQIGQLYHHYQVRLILSDELLPSYCPQNFIKV
ncbi:MAG: hypothetical protein M1822_004081 [Bathelium mastoideum]|nr:MAG: hypothetical protein M1822_004081 [Bathelium mastoideum]